MKKRLGIIVLILTAVSALFLVTACPTDPSETATDILSFVFAAADNDEIDADVTATIDGSEVTANVSFGTDVTALVPAITIPEGASVTPASGEAQDFTDPVTYTVTAGDDSTQDYTVTVTIAAPQAGYKETYTADGVSFDMAYVPGGLTFPIGTNDYGNATVDNAYWIADTEVTYELWHALYTWATGNGYTFANDGREGDDGTDGAAPTGADQEPVTYISWRDSMVWCNALTEWYNAEKGTSYECVYTYSGSIIRDSTNSNCDDADESSTAKGFRLLSSNEYECAARYRDGTLWTYGDHASGDDSGACYDDGTILGGLGMSTVFGDYAWYDGNSGSTHVVGTAGNGGGAARTGNNNALGLYDMSGNVREWCFTEDGSDRIHRGGSWYDIAFSLQVGYWNSFDPDFAYSDLGFRVCRTAD
jgi:formylglycine-generating enzyme required for sulfatase activity